MAEGLEILRQKLEAHEREWADLLERLRTRTESEGPSASSKEFVDLCDVGARISYAFQRLEGVREAAERPAAGVEATAEEARALIEAIDRSLARFR